MKPIAKIVVLFISVLLIGVTPAPGAALDPPAAAISSEMVLKVNDSDHVASALVEKAEALGGYFISRKLDFVVFRIPTGAAKDFLLFGETLGSTVERNYSAKDFGMELSRKKASLKSKEAVLTEYLKVLGEADAKAVVAVEKAITDLIREIEILKGRIRYIRHQLDFAAIRISFKFRDRSAPAADGASSFPWLNTMNISDLVEEYHYETR